MRSVILPPRPFNELPKRNQEFVRHYVRTGDAVEALLQAGYKDNPKTNVAKARKLRNDLAPYVSEELGSYVTSEQMAIAAYGTLEKLLDSDSDAVRLNAAKEILSRGGWDQPKTVEVNHNHKNLDNSDLTARIEALAEQLGLPSP